MRIWLDRERLAAYQLTPQDVEDALRRQNVEMPAGRIESLQREFTVLARDRPAHARAVRRHHRQGRRRLSRCGSRDVGHAELGALDERIVARFNGKPAVALGVVKQATANPLDLSKAVRDALPSIAATLPEGMKLEVALRHLGLHRRARSRTSFTRSARRSCWWSLVIFFFLRTLRATLIPLVTIPVSLIGAFALMYVFGFTINTLTLLALVLAIGLVVDDAIVMLENIYRHIEEGMPPIEAALHRQPRDRLRRHRDDAHAGRGVRAARLHDRPHRPAVHRVRADARRRGASSRASWR